MLCPYSLTPQPMVSLLTVFLLQLDRIMGTKQTHAPGPKKPTLTQTDLGLKGK